LLLLAGGCRQGLYDQARYEPYEASAIFADGAASRPLPAHTIARGFLREDPVLHGGTTAQGGFAATFPVAVGSELLARGRERYNVFCQPCHGLSGDADGMIVQRGFKEPASFHEPRLRFMPAGYFVYVMANGFGQMPSYASQVPPEDRWAIAAYVRALQLSQGVPAVELTDADRARLAAGAAVPTDTAAGSHPPGEHQP
jgi:mono/diheme cytochrome c family protein